MTLTVKTLTLDGVRPGDVLPELRYDVTATTVVLGALATRDTRPMHHDHDFAVNRNGTQDIFLNTPNQAAWFERFLTDWSGPTRPPRAHEVPHEGFGVPRRHDGALGHGRADRDRRRRAAAGPACSCGSPSTAT